MRYFDKIDRAVLRDTKLSASLQHTFNILVDAAPINEIYTIKYMAVLAERAGVSKRTFRRNVAALEKLGLIRRIYRKSPYNPRMNDANCFFIIGADAPRYKGSDFVPEGGVRTKNTPPADKNVRQESISRESSRREVKTKNTLTRETPEETTPNGGDTSPVELEIGETSTLPSVNVCSKDEAEKNPKPENPSWSEVDLGEKQNPQEPVTKAEVVETPKPNPSNTSEPSYPDDIMRVDLTGVPDIMVPTARYWCFRTGRRVLTEKEVAALQWCKGKHMPTYVNKSIDRAIAIWTKQGKLVCQQHFTYIKTMLEHQQTFDPAKKGRRSNKKAAQCGVQTQPIEKPVVELAMPLEAAEKVIVEYRPANRPAEALPVALSELFDGIKAKDAELTDELMATLPKDEDGLEILPEDEGELEALCRGIDLPDYLRLKYPNATDAGLNTDRLSASEKTALATAMEIDKACAYCDSPEACRLPAGSQPGRGRPVATLSNGRIGVGRSPCLMCKHACAVSKPDPDFERKVKECGLTEMQAKRDFASYTHESPEVVVAKARAILAAQNGTNLVLAGKQGVGKTHLSTAIALEAIRSGRKAIVANVPEMLEEICYAAQNHGDVYGLIAKYKSVDCLVLDDWGKERRSDARMDYMYQIINYRYERGLQTIATTNAVTPDGLKDRFYADRIEPLVSRILSNGEWVTIEDAADYRLKPKEAEPAEAPAAESDVTPSRSEQAEALSKPTAESDEKAPESEVVSSAGTTRTSEPLVVSVQSETPAPAPAPAQPQAVEIVVPEPPLETPSVSDEKGLERELIDRFGKCVPDTDTPTQSDEEAPSVDGGVFNWETGQEEYSQEYEASWEAEMRELEEVNNADFDLPSEDERRWSS